VTIVVLVPRHEVGRPRAKPPSEKKKAVQVRRRKKKEKKVLSHKAGQEKEEMVCVKSSITN